MDDLFHTPRQDDPLGNSTLERPPLNTERRQPNFEVGSPVTASPSPHTSPPSSDFHTAATGTSTSGNGSSGAETGYHTPWEGAVAAETKPLTVATYHDQPFTRKSRELAPVARLVEPVRMTVSAAYEQGDRYSLVTSRRTTEVIAPTYAHSGLREYPELKASFRHLDQFYEPHVESGQIDSEQGISYHATDPLVSLSSRHSSEFGRGWEPSASLASASGISNPKDERRNASSPSALSQSSIISGMEWDPYADVGSASHHPTPSGALSYPKSKQHDNLDKRAHPTADAEQEKYARKPRERLPQASREPLVTSLLTLQPVSSSSLATAISPSTAHHGHSGSSSNGNGRRHVGTGTTFPVIQPLAQTEATSDRAHQVNKGVQTETKIQEGQGQDSSSHSRRHRPTPSGSRSTIPPTERLPSRHRRHPEESERSTSSNNKSELNSRSGTLTPTCSFINAVVRSGAPIMMDGKLRQAIDVHRQNHISNVRRELRRVMKLSEILCGSPGLNNPRSSSTLNTSDSHSPNSSADKSHPIDTTGSSFEPPKRPPKPPKESHPGLEDPQPKRRHVNTQNASSSTVQDQTVDELIGTLHRVLQTNRPTPTPSTRASSAALDRTESSKTFTEIQQQQNVRSKRPSPTDQERKIEELNKAFRTILECVGVGPGGGQGHGSHDAPPTTGTSSHRRHPKQKNSSGRTTKMECKPVKPPVSYFLPLPSPFDPIWIRPAHPHVDNSDLGSSDKENDEEDFDREERKLRERLAKLSLQDICSQTHAEFLKRASERANIIASVREVRKKRADLTRKWIGSFGTDDLSTLNSVLPPKGQRVMTSREIRKLTTQKYLHLPEVQEKKLKSKVEKEKETNRLMSRYFSGRLQQGVLKGRVNVELNKSIIRK